MGWVTVDLLVVNTMHLARDETVPIAVDVFEGREITLRRKRKKDQ